MQKEKDNVISRKKNRKRKKFNVWTMVFAVLFIGGLGVLLYPTMCDLYYKITAQKEVKQYERILESKERDFTELWKAAEEYNRGLLNRPCALTSAREEAEKVKGLLNPLGNGMMGYITIPTINVKLPVYQGTEEKELQSGAGYWLGSSLPTGGKGTHCIITAHTGLVKAKMFTDVDKLVKGDTFTLSILDRELTYEVDSIIVTEPSEMEALLIDPDKDYVTLYTCTPYGINTHRLLVRGHRIENEKPKEVGIEQVAEKVFETGKNHYILILVCAIVLVNAVFIAVIVAKKKKRKNTTDK